MTGKTFAVIVVLLGAFCQAAEPPGPGLSPLPTEKRPLVERFALPPASARLLRIIHAQKDNPAEQDRQLQALAAQGFGGFAGNVAFDGYVDDDASGWCAAATLIKGQVDTFLFLNFTYADPLNLTECEGLAVDVTVPQGQKIPAELLVFLHTAEGGRFLAGAGRYLNEPGPSRVYAMFNQFKPFGQTQGELDLSRIASISIGWGGYFGIAGEEITLTVKPPQCFVCDANGPRAAKMNSNKPRAEQHLCKFRKPGPLAPTHK